MSRAEQWRAPLPPCCAAARSAFQEVPDVFAEFPWMQRQPKDHQGEPGFSIRAWDNRPAVATWYYLNDHIIRPTRTMGWSDLIHSVAYPCVVIDDVTTGPHGEPRWAVFRLRPGNDKTFRCTILQLAGDDGFRIITSFARESFVPKWYANMAEKRPWTCAAYALRQRDLDHATAASGPHRWSTASENVPKGCCEIDPGCFVRPSPVPS